VKVLSFVEGASPNKGGLRLVGVPWITKNLAARGHQVVLNVNGRASSVAKKSVQPDTNSALSQKKVLHIVEGLGPLHGGPGMDLPNYCRALADLGCQIVLATVWSSWKDAPSRVLSQDSYIGGRGGYFSIAAFRSLGFHRWRFSPGLLGWLAKSITNFDIVHLHSLYSFPVLAGAILAQKNRLPYILTVHGVLAPVQRNVSRNKKAVYDRLFARRILNQASVIIYSSQQEYQEAAPLGIWAPATIIPNGIALDQFNNMPPRGHFRSKYLNEHQGPLILYLGRLNAKKGLDVLIPGFAQVLQKQPSARLALVGASDPPSYGHLVHNWIKEQGIAEKVVMTGVLSGTDRLSAFVDADIFVLPSRSENFAAAMLEAMACGLPVVVSSGVHLSSEIGKVGAGIVVNLDAGQLASAILDLLSNPVGWRNMGERARKFAENYTCDKTAARLVALYQRLLGGEAITT